MEPKKRVIVPLAEGFEEMEAVIVIDVLRRASLEVAVAGLAGKGPVLGSRGIRVIAEVDWDEAVGLPFDAIVLPGGMGGTNELRRDERVLAAVRENHEAGRLTAAVCAAPLVLASAGLAKGRTVTSHPTVRMELKGAGATVVGDRVVRDGVLLTSQGPGTSMEFALDVVTELVGESVAAEVAAGMCR